MMVIVGAQSMLGRAVIRKLNEENFNYLVLVDDSSSQSQWPDEVKFWYQIPSTELVNWIKNNTEEIEFFIDCNVLSDRNSLDLFLALWRLSHQYQIPIIGVTKSEEVVEETIGEMPPPWFWTILLTENIDTPSQPENIANIIYHYIRNRQTSGVRTVDEISI